MFQDTVMFFLGWNLIQAMLHFFPTEIMKANTKMRPPKTFPQQDLGILQALLTRLKRQASWRSGLRSGLLAKQVSEARGPKDGV